MQILKDDFFAVNRLVRDEAGGAVVVKEIRTRPLAALHFRALDRWLSRRESRLYQLAATIPGVPAYLGRPDPTSYAHRYIEGTTLDRFPGRVSDHFFDELERIVASLHALGMAYVDMAKDENILVGSDGHPYLIDFQVSVLLPARQPFRSLLTPAVARLQREDRYHLAKHKRRYRPDLLSDRDRGIFDGRSWLNRVHQSCVKPLYNVLTRRVLRLPRSRPGSLHGKGR